MTSSMMMTLARATAQRHTSRLRARTLRGERGATLVEYALLVGLLAVASISTIQFMEDRGEDRLTDRQSGAGAPDVNAVAPPSGGGGGGGGGSGGSGGGGTTTVVPTAALTWTSARQGNAWSASVTVTVTDPADGNAGVPGVVVSGNWTPASAGQTSCTTNASGSCTVTQGGMEARSGKPGYVASVTYAVADVTGPGVDYQQTPPSTSPIPAP